MGALRDRTWAEDRVFDSDNTPLMDILAGAGAKPYITVYTDTDVRDRINGMDLYTLGRTIQLVLEIGVASAVQVEGVGGTVLNIPQTDQAMEALIDFVEGQALNAIVTDPRSPWGEIFRQIVLPINRLSSLRGGEASKGTRWAARQVTLLCSCIADPAPGTVLFEDHPVRQFIALAQSSEQEGIGMGPAAALISAMLNDTAAPPWRQAQAWLGLTSKTMHGMGVAPLVEEDEGDSPLKTFDHEEVEIIPAQKEEYLY